MKNAVKNNPASQKVPWKVKLKAWWKGYDIADIEAKMAPDSARKKGENNAQKAKANAETEEDLKIRWDKSRIEATQLVWGNGFCGPGGPQNVIDMSKLLALSPKMSALVIGAGLGGPARVLAKEFGAWINGYENNPTLAEEGMKMSINTGMEKKAPILFNKLDQETSFGRVFERALAKEVLYTIENKSGLIDRIFEQLKDDSLFLITDYVLKSHESLVDPDVVEWLRREPLDPFPVTSDTLEKILEDAGFQIRVHEDITGYFLEMVNEAWADAEQSVQLLAKSEDGIQKNLFAILNEAEIWNRRTKIMRSGELQVRRYLAHKPNQL